MGRRQGEMKVMIPSKNAMKNSTDRLLLCDVSLKYTKKSCLDKYLPDS
jgi:hypothetical protein